jgi:hypothetical protein
MKTFGPQRARRNAAKAAKKFAKDVNAKEFELRYVLFVAKGFDGVEAGGAESWNHAAYQAYDGENER